MDLGLNVLGWFLSIATAIGNAFVIFLIAKRHRLHSSPNWLVLSLAIADFGVGFAVFPTAYVCNYSRACNMRVFMAFYWFFVHSSVTNLCSLTWDRYTAIVHPFKYHTSLTARRPGVVIVLAWFIAFTIALSLVLGMYTTNSSTALKIVRLIGVSAFDMSSCILLFYAVVRILVVQAVTNSAVKSQERHVRRNQALNQSFLPHRRKKRNAVGFVIAIVAFCLGCHVAVNYLVMCITFACNNLSDKAGLVVTLLLVGNSAVNPLVYAFLKRDVKREMKELICGREAEKRRTWETTRSTSVI